MKIINLLKSTFSSSKFRARSFKCLYATLLGMTVATFCLPVMAQNLLTNGDFETPVQARFGNNIGASIAPWVTTGTSLPNVVKVDGPGPISYGTSGPAADNTNPTGIGQYLDITDGSNSFYQVFTVPTCPSEAPNTLRSYKLTGYFSTRDNRQGIASIHINSGTGIGGALVAGSTASVTLLANTTLTGWTAISSIVSLAAGSTFSFVVDMDNFVNADDLSLVLLDSPCKTEIEVLKSTVATAGGPFTFTSTNVSTGSFAAVTTTGTPPTAAASAGSVLLNTGSAGALTTVTEAASAGYALTSINCTGLGLGGTATYTINASGAGGKVDLDAAAVKDRLPGTKITCTFVNTKLPTITVIKTVSESPLVVGKLNQNYTITIKVANSPTAAIINIADILPAGITTSGVITATGGTLSGCPGAGAAGLTGCQIAAGAAIGDIVITVPISVAAAAVAAGPITNTATVSGGGDVLCTGTAPACTGTVTTPVISQKIDTVKAVGVPKQIGPKVFEIDYKVVVGNVGASSPTVYNVQANDNLKATFQTATTITVSGYTVASNSGSATCTAAASYLGTAASSAMLAGTDDLSGGQSCLISFKVTVDYGAAAVPSAAQNNTVYASGMGDNGAANSGAAVSDAGVFTAPTGATTTDISVTAAATTGAPGTTPTAPGLPATAGADAPAGTPTPVSLAAQKIDTVKAAGVPLQTAPGTFEIPYNVVVGNLGAATVYNVQANDNLAATYPAPATFSIKAGSYGVTATGGTCAANAGFNGSTDTKLLAGTDDFATGQSCAIRFTVVVVYGTNLVPATTYNSALASGLGADSATPNPGYTGITQDPTTGLVTGGTPPTGATTTDISATGSPPPAGSPPGTLATPPTLTAGTAPGTPTPVSLAAQKIDTVKAAGVPKQVGPKVFEINYSVVVANVCKSAPLTCATTPAIYNVQANDNLANTFPTAQSIVVSNYAVANGANGALCTAATPAFTGTATASAMLSGTNTLAGGQTCIITFKATVDFGANAIPTISQNNMVYASGTGAATVVNAGYAYAADGRPIPPANAATTDASSTAPPTVGAPGTLPATPLPPTVAGSDSEAGIPTPVVLAIEEDGELLIQKSTPSKEASAGEIVPYTVNITNTSSSAVKSSVTDAPPVGFEYVAGSAKLRGASIANPTNVNGTLVFDIGTLPAKSSVTLTYQMKLGDAVEAGNATNCVSANGVSTLTSGAKESGKSCASVIIKTGLFLEKRANVSKAELGDSVEYSLRVKSVGGTTKNVTINDNLPLGFKLIPGTVKIVRGGVLASAQDPLGAPGPALTFNVGTVSNKEIVEIRYRLRVGIGADLGDGINKAQAKAPFATSSLIATSKVIVTRGVFTRDACIVGKVFIDCNQNKVQDKCEAGSKDACEPGIPGVRLFMEDGTNITTDENGQYSICGVRATSHVMLVDMTTMPIGSRMGLTSNENLGSGTSLLLNIKAGELHRADFIESSCFPKILDQVEQRRQNSAGVVNVPLVQKGGDKPGIVFDAKEQELLAPALRGVK